MVLSSPLDSDAVLARLRTRAKDWRESHLPVEARRAGFYGVTIAVADEGFRLQFQGGPRNPYYPRLDGRIAKAPHGCTVSCVFRPTLGTSAWASLMAAWIAFLSWEAGSIFIGAFAVLLFGMMYWWGYIRARAWRDDLLEVVALAADVRPADYQRGHSGVQAI